MTSLELLIILSSLIQVCQHLQILLICCCLLLVFKTRSTRHHDDRVTLSNETIVFERGEGGYYCIKIPVLISTANGTLLALGEGRMSSCSDFTWTDLVYKRSTDGGKTWGPLTILYSNSSSDTGESNVIGNAAPVVLKDSNRILLPFCRNNLQVLLTYSDDDGVSWSEPVNISGVVHSSWSW